ncbi:hypothetical protein FQN57_004294 [Myotisia sp. PD_48]|nr:hypothetical protein FQN57_004294 [Myotisia sp. PD_48]
MTDSLEERLRSHASAFDGLLSLIPAKYYYGEDNSDQWQRKKQSKEQARDAKRAKLDPDSSKSAKDIMDENARKRKRQVDDDEHGEEGLSDENSAQGSEQPKEGLRRGDAKQKKQKKDASSSKTAAQDDVEANKDLDEQKRLKAEKKAAKLDKQKLKTVEKREKRKEKQKALDAKIPVQEEAGKATQQPLTKAGESRTPAKKLASKVDAAADSSDDSNAEILDMAPVEGLIVDNLQTTEDLDSTAPTSPNNDDISTLPSGESSASSIVPPVNGTTDNGLSETTTQPAPSTTKKPRSPPEELKQRLQKRLDELRAARHADGLNGKPAKNRQELIEARRLREEQRRAHKKEQRQKAKEEEQRLRDEAITKRFSPKGVGSLLSSPGSPTDSITSLSNNFSFGRVVFADGQLAESNLASVRDAPKKRGPQDPATALKAAEAKKERLATAGEEKRADIEEKDMWLNAKKKAHGERVKDDISLLKKALNRKEGLKKRSEKQWRERLEGVAKGQEIRQNKREENIRKRKDEKGNKGKKKGKVKARAGFEGGFKSKAGAKKK